MPEGEAQAGILGDYIGDQGFGVSGVDGVVLHGQAKRAEETAKIIADILGLNPEESRFLGGPEGKAVFESWMFEGLRSIFNAYGLVVCVTHSDQTTVLARAVRNTYYGRNVGPEISPLPMGGAYVLNRSARTLYRYPPEDSRQDH